MNSEEKNSINNEMKEKLIENSIADRNYNIKDSTTDKDSRVFSETDV